MQYKSKVTKLRTACSCPMCRGNNILRIVEGHTICVDCGLVIDGLNIEDIEVKNKSNRSPSVRTNYVFDSFRNVRRNPASLTAYINLLKVSDSTEKKIAFTIATIFEMAEKLGLKPEVLRTSLDIYEELAKKCTFKGKSVKALSAAVIYAACKKTGNVYGLHEIAQAAEIPSNKIFKCYRFVLENLNLTTLTSSFDEYISRICKKLMLNTSVTDIAKKLVKTAKGNINIRGAFPSIVAASIYISAMITKEKKTQREIARVTGVTETTIRSMYKQIIKELQISLSI